uniref:ZP domain-containing protein n=1 Tax=Oryzias melastigma TaxID=30732 RepID=A0A3B3CW71_ORYME
MLRPLFHLFALANFTDSGLMICFNDFYNPEESNDCIKGPVMDKDKPGMSFHIFHQTYFDSLIRGQVKTLTNPLQCYLYFSFFSREREVSIQPLTTHVKCIIIEMDMLIKIMTHVLEYYKDITGCRLSGYGVRLGTTQVNPETCSTDSCSLSAVGTSIPCSDGEYCNGHGSCKPKEICTVTGPTVIDFRGQMNSVSDRCEYSLLHDQSTGFSLKANFLERRRRDVSFVDSLTLDFSDSEDIQLLQGHRVAGSPVTLTGSVQTFSGVDISKDQKGVNASISLQGSSFSVLFDGTTVQIFINVLVGESYSGLCENSSSFSSSRLSSNDRCNVLKSAPFSSCNADVDPQPYIMACNETLSKYPDVDGLRCQFLEAYAKACSWKTNSTVMCESKTCSDHEFCGEINGITGCLCRANFASQYKNSITFGGPTVCEHNSASVTLVGCLLEERGIDYSLLGLLDKTCEGQMDEKTHMVTFNFTSDSCGTIVTTNNSQVIFTNAVTLKNEITRKDHAYIEFSCIYKKPEVNHVAFRIQDSPVVQRVTSGTWNHTVTMKAFADASRTQMLDPSHKVRLNQKVWVELKSSGLDENLISMVTDSCWATNQQSSESTQKYFLIQNGCANLADQTVQVERNGDGILNYFSFNMFKFNDESGDVYLHCKLQLCLKQEGNCIPVCKRRRRSAKYNKKDTAFLSMGWST